MQLHGNEWRLDAVYLQSEDRYRRHCVDDNKVRLQLVAAVTLSDTLCRPGTLNCGMREGLPEVAAVGGRVVAGDEAAQASVASASSRCLVERGVAPDLHAVSCECAFRREDRRSLRLDHPSGGAE